MVMNPKNGEILAEASYPNYDLNNPRDLTKLHTEEELAALSDEEKVKELNSLWNNFCISSGYEPGSTFKPYLHSGLPSLSFHRMMRIIRMSMESGWKRIM